MQGPTGTGCVKCGRGSSTVRICTSGYVVLPTVLSAKINRYRHRATAVAQSCKAGSNLQNPEPPSLRRRHRRRCRLPAGRYWTSMYSNGSFCLSVYGDATAVRCAFFVAMLAGFIDSLAGGGGLLTIPALMAAGMPPAQALATNKLQACGGLSLPPSISFAGEWLIWRIRSSISS